MGNNPGCSSIPIIIGTGFPLCGTGSADRSYSYILATAVFYLSLIFTNLARFHLINLHCRIYKAQIYFVFLCVGNPKTDLKGG